MDVARQVPGGHAFRMTTTTPMTVPARLAARAQERPEDIAIQVAGGDGLTFKAWDDRSTAVAWGLSAFGAKRGEPIAVWCDGESLIDYAVAYVAVHKAGAVAVPVPQRLGVDHLLSISEKAAVDGVIANLSRAEYIERRFGKRKWLASIGQLEQAADRGLREPRDADDDAEILFTSGTTGTPKGVVATHRNLLHTHSAEPTSDDPHVVLHALPPGSVAGQGALLQPLDGVPHRVVALPEYDDGAFVDAVNNYRPTHLVLVPVFAMSLLRSRALGRLDPNSVRLVRTISAPISPATLGELDSLFPNAVVQNFYTSTESFPARLRMTFDPTRADSVGRADHAGEVRIVNDAGEQVGANVAGHIELRNTSAPRRRYLGEDGDSSPTFRNQGWVRMGDIGLLDADGFLYLQDRKEDVINSGGFKISTIEVEAAMHEYPDVQEAAAFGIEHSNLGHYLAAAVVASANFDPHPFLAFVAKRVGPANTPKRVFVRDSLPRNAMGKVTKRQLAEECVRQAAADAGTAQTPLFERVRAIWVDALGESVDETSDFLSLGGNSLHAAAISARIRTELGHRISQSDLFESLSLAAFVSRVEQAPSGSDDPSDRIRPATRP